MHVQLCYGKSHVNLDLSKLENASVIKGPNINPLANLSEEVSSKLKHPTGKGRLADEIKEKDAKDVVIIINDITRPTPYEEMLPPILEELHTAGVPTENIKLLIATGIHREMTEDEIRTVVGDEVADTYEVINHNCDDEDKLVYMGKLRFGTEFYVNRACLATDFLIVTGVIAPHYFAGYSGGRKSVFPGVSGRQSIRHNHSLMKSEKARTCNLEGNPVHLEMLEAARKVGVDFMVNVVIDSQGRAVGVVAGDVEEAWLKGVRIGEQLFVTYIDKPADVVIACAGGFPKDINVYQAQKALDNAAQATRPGGTIVLLAECPEGLGEPTFEAWMSQADFPDDILERFASGFELGGHKAYSLARVVKDKEVVLVSGLDDDTVKKLFFTPAKDLEEALQHVLDKHGPGYKCIIMPKAATIVPVMEVVQ
jgi:nickel-dependent lactate racemase